jgi:2',3'-cyclic-nucleotide 2'-phosphodiesterase/3'-nucleotidase
VAVSHCGTHDVRVPETADVDVVLGGHVHDRRTTRVEGTLLVRTAGNGGPNSPR